MEKNEDEGVCPVNQPAWEGRHDRQIKKMTANKDWYKPTFKSADTQSATVGILASSDHSLANGQREKSWRSHKATRLEPSNPSSSEVQGTGSKASTPVPLELRVEGVLFVPRTPDGALVQQIQKAENEFSKMMKLPRVRVVERVGRKLLQILCRSDP